MSLTDSKTIEGSHIVKQYIVNHSGCYGSAQLYESLHVIISYNDIILVTYCGLSMGITHVGLL